MSFPEDLLLQNAVDSNFPKNVTSPDPDKTPAPPPLTIAIRRLRWVMAAVIFFDILITFSGQPSGWWQDPSLIREDNPLFHLVMSKGLATFISVGIIYVAGSFALVSILPGKLGMALLLAFVLGHWLGGASWLYFHYKLSASWVIAYGALLATVMVAVGFHPGTKSISKSK